jgi:spermidine synthase
LTSLDIPAAQAEALPDERLARWTRILCGLFFCSGFSALIYQLTWQRALSRMLGDSGESITIIVTTLLLGLAIGTGAGGWLSRQRIALLPVLAAAQLMMAVCGIASLTMFDAVAIFASGVVTTAVLAFALVLMPMVLLGATLPIAAGHLVRRSGRVGATVGLLSCANLLGAGTACLAAAVLLFPFLGMMGSVSVAAAVNVTIVVVLAAYAKDRRRGDHVAPIRPAGAIEKPLLGFVPALALACAGGFVTLSYAAFLIRTVSYATGSSATILAATLGTFLIGLAAGARQAARKCKTGRGDVLASIVLDVMLANLVGCLFLPLLGLLGSMGGGVVGVAIVMTFLVARLWGSLMPYAADLAVAADGSSGCGTAFLIVAHSLGAVAGSLVTGYVLTDVLTLTGVYGWLVLCGLLAAALLFVALPVAKGRKHTLTVSTAAYGVIVLMATPIVNADILERLAPKGIERSPLIKVVENRSGIITVDETGSVFDNGLYEGRFATDLVSDANGIVRPYALSLFHPAPRDVLMIGLASGAWAQVIANNPAVRTLTILENNPGYRPLVAQVAEVASLFANPKVAIVTDDARRWLTLNDRRFDAIVSTTIWPFRADASNLLSREFLELVQVRLKRGGIYFYNAMGSDRLQRTGCAVFPHGARVLNHLVVSGAPIAWDFQRWQRVLTAYRIDGKPALDLVRAPDRAVLDQLMGWEASLVLGTDQGAERPIEQCRDIVARTAGKPVITDNNMGSEWRYFLGIE